MIKMKRLHEKGEVATILAISAVIVIGISMISSAFFGGKKQSTSSKASDVCKFNRGLTCDDFACDGTCTDSPGGAKCCTQVAIYDSPTPIPNIGHGPIPDDGIPTDTPPTNAPANTPTTPPLPTQPTTDPVGSGGQPTTAPPANTSSGLCGGNYAACTSNCGSGNDCVKYLKSVTVPGLNDGDVVNTDTFDCDIVTTNVDGARTDRDNICGVKVNGQWPGWCPWNGVLQDTCGATISSRANCNLKSDWFNKNTPVKAGDKLQVVAARKVGSCGNIPWNTAGSFITGPTFYYKQKSGGAGGTAPPVPPTTNNSTTNSQPTTAPKAPASDLGDPTKCPDANNARTIAVNFETSDKKYKCCGANKNPKDPSLNYASWSDNPNPKCLGGSTTAPTSVPNVSQTDCFKPTVNCATECAIKSLNTGKPWICVSSNTWCCPDPNAVAPTKGALSNSPTPIASPTDDLPPWFPTRTPTLTPALTPTGTLPAWIPTRTPSFTPTVEPTKYCANFNRIQFSKATINVKMCIGKGDCRSSQGLSDIMSDYINSKVGDSLRSVNNINELSTMLAHTISSGFLYVTSFALTNLAKQLDTNGLTYVSIQFNDIPFTFTIKDNVEVILLKANEANALIQAMRLPINSYVGSIINTFCK